MGVHVLSVAFTALFSQYMQLIVTHAECDFNRVYRSIWLHSSSHVSLFCTYYWSAVQSELMREICHVMFSVYLTWRHAKYFVIIFCGDSSFLWFFSRVCERREAHCSKQKWCCSLPPVCVYYTFLHYDASAASQHYAFLNSQKQRFSGGHFVWLQVKSKQMQPHRANY